MSNLTSEEVVALMRRVTFEVIQDMSRCPELMDTRILICGDFAQTHYVPGYTSEVRLHLFQSRDAVSRSEEN